MTQLNEEDIDNVNNDNYGHDNHDNTMIAILRIYFQISFYNWKKKLEYIYLILR